MAKALKKKPIVSVKKITTKAAPTNTIKNIFFQGLTKIHRGLKLLAEKEGTSMSKIIRELVIKELQRKKVSRSE